MKAEKQEPVEYAGHWVDGNIWFKVGLNKTEAAALKLSARRLLKGGTSAEAAHWLLRAALAHFDELHAMLANDLRYAEAEGLDHGRYLESLAARAQGIAPKRAIDGRSLCCCRIEVEVGGRWLPYFEACREAGLKPLPDEGNWMTARRAVSGLRRVRAQFPQRGCRVHKDGADHRRESKSMREWRQP